MYVPFASYLTALSQSPQSHSSRVSSKERILRYKKFSCQKKVQNLVQKLSEKGIKASTVHIGPMVACDLQVGGQSLLP